MGDIKDLELIFHSRTPLVVIQTHEERRVIDMLKKLIFNINKPLFTWTVTEGLRRIDMDMDAHKNLSEPAAVLRHIKASPIEAVFAMLDFHHYISDDVNARLIKEIAHNYYKVGHHMVLISHEIDLPDDLRKMAATFRMELPGEEQLLQIVKDEAYAWSTRNNRKKVQTNNQVLNALVRNLRGLTVPDARRMTRKVIYDDGAITDSDIDAVMAAKYELLNRDGLLSFEYDTEKFTDVGGMAKLKRWLELRKAVLTHPDNDHGLQQPKGILLLGVQGGGKSLVSKAVAGVFSVPLLRLDFGVLYNKFFGESEKNLREALKTAEVMAPCVLWIDEIEKGLATGENDGGTSRRVLGTLLTWMAENDKSVFLVATANDIESLPPELIRKGRFDEIFFVDLPNEQTRAEIFRIHLNKRNQQAERFDTDMLARESAGYSGAEIEQAVVSALYAIHADGSDLTTEHVLEEIRQTRPLSVVMAEKIDALRRWAGERTVPVD